MPHPSLLHLLTQQSHRPLSPQQTGQAVDLLYQLQHFQTAAQTYGRGYLVMLVEMKMIETYLLRKNSLLIDARYFYVLVEGKVDKGGYATGAELNLQRDGQINTVEDCVFLRMLIHSRAKRFLKLKQFEQQKLQQFSLLHTRLHYDDQKLSLIQKLVEIQNFAKLPKADLNELAYNCTMKNLPKGKITHEHRKPVQSLIYIIDGEVKISLPFQIQQTGQNLDSYLEKYMVRQGSKDSKHEVCANYSRAQWIGMQEHFESTPFNSFGVVMSVQAKLLYIPVHIFDKLFNTKANHVVFTKIRYLRQIKAQLLENSSKVQQKKQAELLRWSQQKASMSPQLRKKISKYQLEQPTSEQDVGNPESSNDIWDKKQPTIPTKVVHIVKSQNSHKQTTPPAANTVSFFTQTKSPTIQRVNLFPEEYAQQFIYPNQMRQIQDAQYKKNINLMMYMSPKHHRKACKSTKTKDKNPLNLEGEVTLEKSFFYMSKKVSENFALGSTFYRSYLSNGDEQMNLNFKTISQLQPSRRDLLLRRKSQIHQQINRQSSGSFILPGLNSRPTIKQFQPMNPQQKSSTLDLSQYLLKNKYHLESGNSLNLRSKQSHQTLFMRNSSSKISDLREYNKTLFINRERLQSELKGQERARKEMGRTMQREPSMLSIE